MPEFMPAVPDPRADHTDHMDPASTFAEAGGVKPPAVMTGRGFMNVLRSNQTENPAAER